jgi:hypothetical protein
MIISQYFIYTRSENHFCNLYNFIIIIIIIY